MICTGFGMVSFEIFIVYVAAQRVFLFIEPFWVDSQSHLHVIAQKLEAFGTGNLDEDFIQVFPGKSFGNFGGGTFS